MERQDRLNGELLQRIVDLPYRVDDPEAAHPQKTRKQGSAPEAFA
jgi:hypothetical protein